MSRRVSLPGADELFRTTSTGPEGGGGTPAPVRVVRDDERAEGGDEHPALSKNGVDRDARLEPAATRAVRQTARRRGRPEDRSPSGRERHDEKITVYVSADELFEIEQARLTLRGEHGLAVDRGRIVREAVAVVLADLESKGDTSILVRRLRGQ